MSLPFFSSFFFSPLPSFFRHCLPSTKLIKNKDKRENNLPSLAGGLHIWWSPLNELLTSPRIYLTNIQVSTGLHTF